MMHPRCRVLFVALLVMPMTVLARELPDSIERTSASTEAADRHDTVAAEPPILTAMVTPARGPEDVPLTRPRILIGMYAASALLQGYDTYSTLAGLSAHNVELNPIVRDLAKNPSVLIATKSAVTLATVVAAEQLWRQHHPGQAIALMIVSNGLMAAIGARNAAVLRTR